VSCLILTTRRGALTAITCVQCDPVDACHDINTLNVQTPLPPPKDNRRLWLHHLNRPSLFSSGGGLSLPSFCRSLEKRFGL
jgi:hypothetical protein